jgi:two-component system, chemotaxis family, response regulator Rcp1
MKNDAHAIDILLIEDHPGDARLTQEAFRDTSKPVHVHHVWDGAEAIAFLTHLQGDDPRPSVILLDLSMPRMSGGETLALLKSDASLGVIPVIVLTTSEAEADVSLCYNLGANCYL